MHIVYVTSELATKDNPTGGMGTFVANMARLFKENGHTVDILVVSTKEQNVFLSDDICVENICIPIEVWNKLDKIAIAASDTENQHVLLRRYNNIVYKAQKVANAIERINGKCKIDIVHYSNHGCLQLFATSTIPYVVRISGFLDIWHSADSTEKWNVNDVDNSWYVRMENQLLLAAKNIISPSNLIKKIGEQKYKIPNIDVIESPYFSRLNNIDDSVMLRKLNGKRYVLHYGTLSYLKGTHVVARCAKQLLEDNPDIYLVIAGRTKKMISGEKEITFADYVLESAAEYFDRVIYLGQLSREQLYPIIENAELCWLPSRIENLSNACIEAMSMGKLVVATDGASYEQIIENNVSGFLCELDNVQEHLQTVERVLGMSDVEKKKMAEVAKNTVKRLQPQLVYKEYVTYYEDVINNWENKF